MYSSRRAGRAPKHRRGYWAWLASTASPERAGASPPSVPAALAPIFSPAGTEPSFSGAPLRTWSANASARSRALIHRGRDVARILDCVKLAFDAEIVQPLDHFLGAADLHQLIAIAVKEEHRRGVGGDIGCGRRIAIGVWLGGPGAAQPIGQTIVVGRYEAEVTRSTAGEHELEPRTGGVGRHPGFAKLFVFEHAEQRHQMAARRIAEAADLIGIDLILARMLAHPTHGSGAVVDLCRPLILWCETIFDRRSRVSMLGEEQRRAGQLLAGSYRPRTAMHHEYAWKRPCALGT